MSSTWLPANGKYALCFCAAAMLFAPAVQQLLLPGVALPTYLLWLSGMGAVAFTSCLWFFPRQMPALLGAALALSPFVQAETVALSFTLLPELICMAIIARHARKIRLRDPLLLTFALLAGWFILSAFLSERPLTALGSAGAFVLPFAAFYLHFRSSSRWRDDLCQFFLGAGLVAIVLVGYHFAWSPYFNKAAIRPFFPDANVFSAFLSLLFPGLIWAAWQRDKASRWPGLILLVLSIGLCVGLLGMRSRGAWVGLLGAGLVMIFYWLDNALQRGLLLGAVLLLGLVVAGILSQYLQDRPALPGGVDYVLSASDVQADFSNRERLMRWTCAVRMWREDPLAGHGPGTFAPDFKFLLRDAREVRQISYWFGWKGGAHSVWLTSLAETGIVGLLGLVVLAGLFFRRAFSGRNRDVVVLFAVFAVAGWTVHGVFDDLLMVIPLAGMLGAWMGVLGQQEF